jgi:2-amino-4-hydroxy-6-hydroxymethyldihydropteridine diphosphokinase
VRYLVALGSNRRHPRHGGPRAVLAAALQAMEGAELEGAGLTVLARSRVHASAPVGPSARTYANGAALVETRLDPPALLELLQEVEHSFGRRRRGRAWSSRVLDLDIVLWSGGCWAHEDLVIPHPHFRRRAFVLGPALEICRDWRDPLTGQTLAQLHARLTRPRALPKRPAPTHARRTGP